MAFKHLVDRFVIMYIYGHKKGFAANKGVVSFDFKSHQKQVRSINQLVIVMMSIFVGSMTVFFSTRAKGNIMLLPHAIACGLLLFLLICVFIGYYTSLNLRTFFFQKIWYPLKRHWTKDHLVEDELTANGNYVDSLPSNLAQSDSGSMYLKPPVPTPSLRVKTGVALLDQGKKKRRVKSFDVDKFSNFDVDELPKRTSLQVDDPKPQTPESPLTAPTRLMRRERGHIRGSRSYGSDEFTQIFYPSAGVAVTPTRVTEATSTEKPSVYQSKRFRQAYEPPFKYLQLLDSPIKKREKKNFLDVPTSDEISIRSTDIDT
jgi:hypothetical protein